jgi:adenosylhomocysteinase
LSEGKKRIRPSVEEFSLQDGRKLYLLGEGRLVNWPRRKAIRQP